MRRFTVTVTIITVSKFVFVEVVNLRGRATHEYPKSEPPRFLMIPQYVITV